MSETSVYDFDVEAMDLSNDLEFLTNRLKSQLRTRLGSLLRKEREVLEEVNRLRPRISAEVATDEQEERYYAAQHSLKRIRLDIVDTREAIGIVSVDNVTEPIKKYSDGEVTITVDDREEHL